MSHPVSHLIKQFGLGLVGLLAAASFCLGLPGCTSLDLRGDGFQDNGLSSFCQKYRPADDSIEPWAFSNKAQQIERDFGAR